MVTLITVDQGRCEWGGSVTEAEDAARHAVYEATLRSLIESAHPGAAVRITIDRRLSGAHVDVVVRDCDIPRQVDWRDTAAVDAVAEAETREEAAAESIVEMTGEAWQVACEASVKS